MTLASSLSSSLLFHVLSVHFISITLHPVCDLKHVDFYSDHCISASCFTVGSLVVDMISLSVFFSDWHVVGLVLPSVHETWWDVCVFHLYLIQRNICLSSQDLPRPAELPKAFMFCFYSCLHAFLNAEFYFSKHFTQISSQISSGT